MYFLPLPHGQGSLRPILGSAGHGCRPGMSTVHLPILVYPVDCRTEQVDRLAANLCDLLCRIGRKDRRSVLEREKREDGDEHQPGVPRVDQRLPGLATKLHARHEATGPFAGEPDLLLALGLVEKLRRILRSPSAQISEDSVVHQRQQGVGGLRRVRILEAVSLEDGGYPLVREGSLGTDRGSREQALDEGEHALFSRTDAVGRIVEHAGYRSGDAIGGRWPGCRAHGGACPFGGGTRSH